MKRGVSVDQLIPEKHSVEFRLHLNVLILDLGKTQLYPMVSICKGERYWETTCLKIKVAAKTNFKKFVKGYSNTFYS